MANDTSGSVWSIDTTAEIKAAGTRVKVLKMVWEPNAAADTLVVRDGNQNSIIWNRTALSAAGSGGEEELICPGKGITFTGMHVTISAGTLRVHVR